MISRMRDEVTVACHVSLKTAVPIPEIPSPYSCYYELTLVLYISIHRPT